MADFANSKTAANLAYAFAGESQARNKYTYFASVAKKEGYQQIAAIFEQTANNEKEHAKMWFKELQGIGTTADNLLSAAEGENYEWTDMYATFADEAEEEGSPVTVAEFAALGTRVLPITRETRTINAYGYQRGDLRGMPEWCITIGMKQILTSRKIYIALNRPWQHGIFKHVLSDDVQPQIPATLLKTCDDVTFCLTKEIAEGLF
jgi:rubrerythrin